MNTGDATLEPSTVWTRFLSWLSPVKAVTPEVAPPASAPEVVPSEAREVVPSEAPEVVPSGASPSETPVPSTPLLQSGRSLEVPLDTKPLEVQAQQENVEQPNKNDTREEQPNPGASSAKSHQKKKKRH